jgi:hypothetical protein
MLDRGLITTQQITQMSSQIEPLLYRYPAVDPPSFRRAVDEMTAP